MIKAILLSSLALNLSLMLGRLSGFAREVVLASTYGATAEADVVVLMLTVPDLLVNILIGGALGAALIPEFNQHPDRARKLLYQSMLFFGLIFVVIAGGLSLRSDLLVKLLVPGFSGTQAQLAALTLGWVIWLVPLTVLTGVVTAYLHAQNRFAIAGLGTLIINCSIIAGLLLVYFGYGALPLLAIFILFGGVLRLVSQLLQARPGWSPLASLQPRLLNKSLLTHYAQAMLSGSVLLLFPVVARAIASYEDEGSVAILNYAIRLVEFPLAIAVTFVAAVFFPRLSGSFTGNPNQHRQLIHYGVQITLALSLVAATVLILLSGAYAEFVYAHGNMTDNDVAQVTELITIGLIAVPLQGLSGFLTSVFYSQKETRTPLLINSSGLAFFLMSTYFDIFGPGLQALMWGIVASYGLICMLQLFFLKIENFNWWQVLLDKSFLPGSILAVALLAFASHQIEQAELSAWLSLLLAGFVALLSIVIIALFNREIRTGLKTLLIMK